MGVCMFWTFGVYTTMHNNIIVMVCGFNIGMWMTG